MKTKAPRLTTEHAEQSMLFQWAALAEPQHPELAAMYAVPNFARISPRWGAWMKAEGKRAGVPDIVLPVARNGFHSLYIEMKMPGALPSAVKPAQHVWHARLAAQGNCVRICYGFEKARDVILAYLASPLSQHGATE